MRTDQVNRLADDGALASGIGAGFEDKYLNAMDLTHTHRRLGP